MNETTNYGLKKPEQDDFYDIDDMNLNADTLDTELQKNAQATATAQTTADQALGAVGSINASTPEQVAAVGAKVDAVSSKVTAVDGKVVAVGTKVDTANTAITAIKADVANLDGDVAAVGTKVSNVDSKVVAVDGKITTVGTKVDTANTGITGVSGKIGASTDGETAATLFGRMLGIRNVVDWIKNTWTATKAGLLDVAVSSRAPASTALSTATWTSTRAGRLDNLDGKISEVGKSLNTYSIPSDNVKKTIPGLAISVPARGSDYKYASVILNYTANQQRGVRFKVYVTSATADMYFAAYHPYYDKYSSAGRNESTSMLQNLFKPQGSLLRLSMYDDWTFYLIGIAKNASNIITFDLLVLEKTPLMIFAAGEGTLQISKIEICYDEVDI